MNLIGACKWKPFHSSLCKWNLVERKRQVSFQRQCIMQFVELSSDLFKILFASHNPIQLRLICRDIKWKIESSPEFTIHLSTDGTQNASSAFFVRFKGELSVGSRHGWDHQKGWFPSLIVAIQRGLRVNTILPLTVNGLNLPPFSSMLHDVCRHKIQKLSIKFCGTLRSLSNSIALLSTSCKVAERIDLNLEIIYRRPRDMLKDVIDQIKGLGDAISVKTLFIRSVFLGRYLGYIEIPCVWYYWFPVCAQLGWVAGHPVRDLRCTTDYNIPQY